MARSRPTMSSSPPAPISAADARPAARRNRLSGPCQPLQKSRAASAGRGAGGRLRRVGRADRRRVAARRPPRLSLGRPAPPPAAPLPRPRSDLVDCEMGLDQTPEQRGPARLGPVDLRRLWRPHHRLPPLRRRWHDPVGTREGGARWRDRDRARSRRKPGRRRPRLHHLPRHGGRLCEAARPGSARRPRRPRDVRRPALRHRTAHGVSTSPRRASAR